MSENGKVTGIRVATPYRENISVLDDAASRELIETLITDVTGVPYGEKALNMAKEHLEKHGLKRGDWGKHTPLGVIDK